MAAKRRSYRSTKHRRNHDSQREAFVDLRRAKEGIGRQMAKDVSSSPVTLNIPCAHCILDAARRLSIVTWPGSVICALVNGGKVATKGNRQGESRRRGA
jgi:hypothetical protein